MSTLPLPGRRRFLGALLGSAAALSTRPTAANPQPRKVLVQHSPLAGFQYHHGEDLWPSLRVGDTLTLVREPQNRYDDCAVRVDWQGRKLGYVPRRENVAVAQMLDRGERLEATLAALSESRNPWGRIEFKVRLLA